MKLYTGTGDKGKTSLAAGLRVDKTDARIGAIGAVDELNSFVGLARSLSKSNQEILEIIQRDLFSIGAELAGARNEFQKISQDNISALEKELAQLEKTIPELHNFVLPGGTQYAAALHVCRSVCRRAERSIIKLEQSQPVSQELKTYLNRLSSLFFGLALAENKQAGVKETPWNAK